ncbi:hypothetical protein D3C75_1247860 [compost metagenome]
MAIDHKAVDVQQTCQMVVPAYIVLKLISRKCQISFTVIPDKLPKIIKADEFAQMVISNTAKLAQ